VSHSTRRARAILRAGVFIARDYRLPYAGPRLVSTDEILIHRPSTRASQGVNAAGGCGALFSAGRPIRVESVATITGAPLPA
jgi:hypothetical protein